MNSIAVVLARNTAGSLSTPTEGARILRLTSVAICFATCRDPATCRTTATTGNGCVDGWSVTEMHRWLVPLIVTAHAVAASADQVTDKKQQSTIARWTAEKICEMGVDAFYALQDSELKTMFERDTSMRYEDVPAAPNDQERARITGQLMGYLMAACPKQLESYKNR